MDKKCISVKELGAVMGISRSVAYSLAQRADFFPAFRLGSKILIRVDALDRWLDGQQK